MTNVIRGICVQYDKGHKNILRKGLECK